MRKIVLLMALLLLSACVPEYQEPQTIAEKIKPKPAPVVNETVLEIPDTPVKVWQTRGSERILWGYSRAGDLVLINSSKKTVVLDYLDHKLLSIDDGVKPLKFYYDSSDRLNRVEKGIRKWIFTYSSKGNLLTMEDGEDIGVTYDSKGRLSSVARDGGPSTEFEYDDLNRTKMVYKAKVGTEVRYDSEGRIAMIRRQDDYIVLGYWRYNLLSSLSGPMYGLKETVNYGPSTITLISNTEQNAFESEDPEDFETRAKSFNTFLFCTRFRKLPVIFDGQSWVMFREYFKGSIKEYLTMGFVCDSLP
jgi:YD repeat-containing protein